MKNVSLKYNITHIGICTFLFWLVLYEKALARALLNPYNTRCDPKIRGVAINSCRSINFADFYFGNTYT